MWFMIGFVSLSWLVVLGSDVIYNEDAVVDLLDTLMQLCGTQTTIILAGELRNGLSHYNLSSWSL